MPHSVKVLVPRGASEQVVEALVREKQRLEPDKTVRLYDKTGETLLDVRAPLNRYYGGAS